MHTINHTHDASLTSWVNSANVPDADFPIQNLPFAIFRSNVCNNGCNETFRGGVAIGDQIIDMAAVAQLGIWNGDTQRAVEACATPSLNQFMSMGLNTWHKLRSALSAALTSGSEQQPQLATCLVAQTDAEYSLPCQIGDFTDFYSSIHHATRVGSLFRPDNPLLPNYKWVPIAYHGRASSIGVSGQNVRRPQGQVMLPDNSTPTFGPCQRLDYEVEMGIFIGPGNPIGQPLTMDQAADSIFGLCLLNDWSARDIQAWEYQPLGPFLSKSFASTVSPWIITTEALAPFRTAFSRPESDPRPLAYLNSEHNTQQGAFDIHLQCYLRTEQHTGEAFKLSTANMKDAYWTAAQMVAHHTVNGCNLQPGDLLGSGTQSGPEVSEGGCLLELTQAGKHPIDLGNGQQRRFLEDGDSVIMRGYCEREGYRRIGFGEVRSQVLPAQH